jgi:hypothetical protein
MILAGPHADSSARIRFQVEDNFSCIDRLLGFGHKRGGSRGATKVTLSEVFGVEYRPSPPLLFWSPS